MDSQTRQEYIMAAVSFLQNPKLVDSSLKDKLKFLRDKGLSDFEVDEALNLALVNRQQSSSGRWNFLIILGLCIGGYSLYQAYLDSKIKQKVQEKNLAKSSSEKSKLIHDIQTESKALFDNDQPTLNEILKRVSELKRLIELQRTNFGTEIQSLKTLLLGHEKFAAPPKIPEWQLKDDKKEGEGTGEKSKVAKGGRQNKEKKDFQEPMMQSFSNGSIGSSVIAPNLG